MIGHWFGADDDSVRFTSAMVYPVGSARKGLFQELCACAPPGPSPAVANLPQGWAVLAQSVARPPVSPELWGTFERPLDEARGPEPWRPDCRNWVCFYLDLCDPFCIPRPTVLFLDAPASHSPAASKPTGREQPRYLAEAEGNGPIGGPSYTRPSEGGAGKVRRASGA
jgi:hypothetical protein